MASSSTNSSIRKSFKYDVFLSFRGEDTRNNFVGHLYHALQQEGIATYKDDEKIEKGKTINDQLLKSIEDSRFYIIVFSKMYASSSWCLDELVKIMECQRTVGHTAYPVFYDVEPTEVRKQSGQVGKAFSKQKKFKAAGKWKEAMKEASNLAGWELKKTANGYAFDKETPIHGFKKLSTQVIQYASGLPLTIRVLGSFLCGKSELEWIDAMERLKTFPLKDTLEILELSYNALEDDCKEIFLDVACILKGEQKDKAIRVLKSCGFHASIGLKVLEQKSLITISENGRLGMHDHLEEMGKNIVRRLHPNEPHRHSRLWNSKEIEDVLANNMVNEEIRCIKLLPQRLDYGTVMRGLGNMKKLRVLYMHFGSNWNDSEVSQCFPDDLRYLSWRAYPFWSLHETFQADNLVGLDMSFGSIAELQKGEKRKVLDKLRFLDLSYTSLILLDVELTPNIEILDLEQCLELTELHIPNGCPKLKYLGLDNSTLWNLNLGPTPDLKTLSLLGCYDLEELHIPF